MVIFHSYVSLPEGTPKWTFSGNAGCCEYWVLRLDSSWQEFPPLSVADLGSPSVAQQTDLDTLTNLGQYQIQIMELEYTQSSSSSPSSSSSDYNPTHHHNERCQTIQCQRPNGGPREANAVAPAPRPFLSLFCYGLRKKWTEAGENDTKVGSRKKSTGKYRGQTKIQQTNLHILGKHSLEHPKLLHLEDLRKKTLFFSKKMRRVSVSKCPFSNHWWFLGRIFFRWPRWVWLCQIHGPNHQSMDWFKGKFSPESPIFNGKILWFPVDFPLNQSIESTIQKIGNKRKKPCKLMI